MNEQSNATYPYEPEFSFKKVISDRKEDLKYLLHFKKLFLAAIIFGISGGVAAAWLWPVSYTSRMTFIIEDSKGGGGGSVLAGLAGQFGLDMSGALGGTSGVLAGDNVMALLKSESMIKRVLLTPFPGKENYSLADQFADSYKLKNGWAKQSEQKQPIMFPVDRSKYTRLQDSLLQDMTIRIAEKCLSISKPDKKLSFFELNVTSRNETFSQIFSTRIIEEATSFYIYTKTKTQRINVNRLQTRADSIGHLLNKKTYSASSANRILLDVNPAYPTAQAGVELQQRDKMVLQTIYGEIIKNLEMSRTMLNQETPTFQIVDSPDMPLKKNKLKYPRAVVMGIAIAVFLCALYLLMFRRPTTA